MNISFDLLKIFKLVAYYGNVSKASKVLCVTQPSVTKSIKKLEDELGVKLFIREKQGVRLSPDGEKIYRFILDPINALENVKLIAKGVEEIESGSLKIGADSSIAKIYLFKTIYNFKRLYPNVSVEVYNSNNNDLYNKLKSGKLDIVFIDSELEVNSSYEKFLLCEQEFCFFCTKEYDESIKKFSNIKAAISNNLIMNSSEEITDFLSEIFIKNGMKLNPSITINDYRLLLDYVLASMGIGFAPKQVINKLIANGDLVEIPSPFQVDKKKTIGIYRDFKNVKIDKFCELLKQ